MDFAHTPTLIETALSIFLIIASLALRTYARLNKAKLTDAEQKRLVDVATMAAGAAEEMGAREAWSGAQKLSYAQEAVKRAFPNIKNDLMDDAIHAGLAVLELGNIGASDYRKSNAK